MSKFIYKGTLNEKYISGTILSDNVEANKVSVNTIDSTRENINILKNVSIDGDLDVSGSINADFDLSTIKTNTITSDNNSIDINKQINTNGINNTGIITSTNDISTTNIKLDNTNKKVKVINNNNVWDNYICDGQGTLIGKNGTGTNGEIFNDYIYNTASGNYSHAEGSGTEASGSKAHAEGNSTHAKGMNSHTEGSLTYATNSNSHAEGTATRASGISSHSSGSYTISSQENEFVIGTYNIDETGQTTNKLFVIGNGTDTNNRNDLFFVKSTGEIEGDGTITAKNGNNKIKLDPSTNKIKVSTNGGTNWDDYSTGNEGVGRNGTGTNGEIFNDYSNNIASGNYSHAEGSYEQLIISNVSIIDQGCIASGRGSHAEGVATTASNEGSHAEGYFTFAQHNEAHAEGCYCKATGESSHCEGKGQRNGGTITFNIASGARSHCEGYINTASGAASHAEGGGCIAEGEYAHAEGVFTYAKGKWSHAEGAGSASNNKLIASGTASHAEGYNTTASGNYGAHAEGASSTASGRCSHCEGDTTTASHYASHASGNNTTTGADCQTVIGKFNEVKSDCLFVVGNGADANNRSNAFVVYNNGSIGLNNYLFKTGSASSKFLTYASSSNPVNYDDTMPVSNDNYTYYIINDIITINIPLKTGDKFVSAYRSTSDLNNNFIDKYILNNNLEDIINSLNSYFNASTYSLSYLYPHQNNYIKIENNTDIIYDIQIKDNVHYNIEYRTGIFIIIENVSSSMIGGRGHLEGDYGTYYVSNFSGFSPQQFLTFKIKYNKLS